MQRAINEGRLLDLLPLDTPVEAMYAPPPKQPILLLQNGGAVMSDGAIAGSVIGAVCAGIIAVALFVKINRHRRRRREGYYDDDGSPKNASRSVEIPDEIRRGGPSALGGAPPTGAFVSDRAVGGEDDGRKDGVIGATAPNYGTRSRTATKRSQVQGYDDLEGAEDGAAVALALGGGGNGSFVEEEKAECDEDGAGAAVNGRAKGTTPTSRSRGTTSSSGDGNVVNDSYEFDASVTSSSYAGSSGWSSSAGVSSLNTASVEGSLVDTSGDGAAGGATLAAIGAASAVTSKAAARESQRQSQMRSAKGGMVAAESVGAGAALDDGSKGESTMDSYIGQTPSRSDFDTAIDAGDWAAVGATAALLASASEAESLEASTANRSREGGHTTSYTSPSKSTVSSLDNQRAAELDRLVDAGDWEGVVMAAAKFEALEGDKGAESVGRGASGSDARSVERSLASASGAEEYSRSFVETRSTGTGGHSVGTSSAYSAGIESAGVSTSISESPTNAQKRAEIRSEVESLVQRVVPDEIDNVDEMLLQFHGREEELVETLRTMQERSIAQRNRAAVHKTAKREAKRSVLKERKSGGGKPSMPPPGGPDVLALVPAEEMPQQQGLGSPAAAAAFAAATLGAAGAAPVWLEEDSREEVPLDAAVAAAAEMEAESGDGSSRKRAAPASSSPEARTALERAIEAGDWEAVGEAAAMMSDASATTADIEGRGGVMSEESFDRSVHSGASRSTGWSSRKSAISSAMDADRAAELDELIDNGDWSGVVAAASKYSAVDNANASSASKGSRRWKKPRAASAGVDSGSSGASQGSGSGSSRGWRSKLLHIGSKRKDAAGQSPAAHKQPSGDATQEEQDALEQAEIWMAIAEQSKQRGEEPEGASDAADWAIQRSLSALRHAEMTGNLEAGGDGGGRGSGGASGRKDESSGSLDESV
uniref:Uncharacterized protein n=1 Tax=Odontella aurita TaxID=265563 RepID=A0A7S4JUP7_9STRA